MGQRVDPHVVPFDQQDPVPMRRRGPTIEERVAGIALHPVAIARLGEAHVLENPSERPSRALLGAPNEREEFRLHRGVASRRRRHV
jgi:hypothetical protein